MVFVVLCPGALEGSSDSSSGLKTSQKTGPGINLRLGEPGIELGTPELKASNLSTTPQHIT